MYPEIENFYCLVEYEVVHIKAEIVPCPKHRLVLVSNKYQHKVCTQKEKL